MKQVWKYPIRQRPIEMPTDAKVVHFGMQGGQAMVWVEVGVTNVTSARDLCVYGTGHEIPEHAKHLGTCFDGPFVWHLYDRG